MTSDPVFPEHVVEAGMEQVGWLDEFGVFIAIDDLPSDHELATAYADGPPEVQHAAVMYLEEEANLRPVFARAAVAAGLSAEGEER